MSFLYTFLALVIGFSAGFAYRARIHTPAPPVSKEQSQEGRDAVQARIQKRKARIMKKARTQGRITNDDVEDLFCISDATARNYLSALTEEGELTQKGAGRGTYYEPKNR